MAKQEPEGEAQDPEEMLVISAWSSEEHWNEWFQNEERGEVQQMIDDLLGRQTYYQVYYNA